MVKQGPLIAADLKRLTFVTKGDDKGVHRAYREVEGNPGVYLYPKYYKPVSKGIAQFFAPSPVKAATREQAGSIASFLPRSNIVLQKNRNGVNQVAVHDEIVKRLRSRGGCTLKQPCGTGKTKTALKVAETLAEDKVVILCTKGMLIDQWRENIKNDFTGINDDAISVVRQKEEEKPGSKFVLCSVQTLMRRPEMKIEGVGLLIWDEAHHAPADKFRQVMYHNVPDFQYSLALSATPERRDGLEGIMYSFLGELYEAPVRKAAGQKGYSTPQVIKVRVDEDVHRSMWCDPAEYRRHLEEDERKKEEQEIAEAASSFARCLLGDYPNITREEVRRYRGHRSSNKRSRASSSNGVYSRGLTNLTKDFKRNDLLVDIVRCIHRNFGTGRKGLLLSDRVGHLQSLYKDLTQKQPQIAAVSKVITGTNYKKLKRQKTGKEEEGEGTSKDVFADFLTLSTYGLFSEAIDFDGDFLILATPRSEVQQCAGRIMRGHSGFRPTIIDLVDVGSKSLPHFQGMYRKREKYYRKEGMEVVKTSSTIMNL